MNTLQESMPKDRIYYLSERLRACRAKGYPDEIFFSYHPYMNERERKEVIEKAAVKR